MSLLSQWTTDKTNMNTLYDKSSDVHGGQDSGGSTSDADYLESLMNKSRKNQWRISKITPWAGSRVSPTTTHLTQYIATAGSFRNQDTGDWAWGDKYIGIRECWLYFNNAQTITTTFYSDDEGTVFLNGSQIVKSASCTNTSCTLNFKKGLNHLMLTFCEDGGGDYCYITTNPFTLSNVKWAYAEFDKTK